MTTNVNLGFVADAAGTVDVITATYTPTYTVLIDKMLVWFRATGANTSATPTFSPNGLTAHTIVKQGGQPLVAGDIPRAGAVMEMVYDSANTRWELVNPATSGSGWADDGANVRLTTITDNVGIGTATPTNKLEVAGGITSTSTDNSVGWTIGFEDANSSSKIVIGGGVINASATTLTAGATVNQDGLNGQYSIRTTGDNLLLQDQIGNGDVGIGTSSPAAKLHVNGSVLLESISAYDDDAAAGLGGLVTGNLYQTTGNGAAPLNVAGILMAKQ